MISIIRSGAYHLPSETHKRVLPANDPGSNVGLASRRETPSSGTKRSVEDATIFDFRQVDQTVWLLHGVSGVANEKSNNIPGFISTSNGSIGASKTSAISFGNGCIDRPL